MSGQKKLNFSFSATALMYQLTDRPSNRQTTRLLELLRAAKKSIPEEYGLFQWFDALFSTLKMAYKEEALSL